jgi:hypothetical protein
MEHVYHVSLDGFVISATTMCMNVAIVKMTQSLNEANFPYLPMVCLLDTIGWSVRDTNDSIESIHLSPMTISKCC